jgi:NAD(P)-dependent dehydrogenase (short-subunit alcohol dehydrogenase family)
MNLKGRKVVVTGGSGGIGSALVVGLSESGAQVYNLDLKASEVELSAQFIEVDLTSEPSVKAAMAQIPNLDAIVVSAGIQLVGEDARIEDVSLQTWQRTIDINLTGAFLSLKYALPKLVASGSGSAVLIGSPTAISMEGAGYSSYAASKAGMMALSRVIAADYKDNGVRSNVVIPGAMNTPLIKKIWDDPAKRDALVAGTPLGRIGNPSELVGLVNWLVSTESSFATGASYAVDGGMTAR